MGYVDDYDSYTTELEKGTDDKGNYRLIQISYEVPCGCHPETCCCSGRSWRSSKYKQYEDGSKVSVT